MQPSPDITPPKRRFRQLLQSQDVAEPDRVEYDPDELTFFWEESKVAVIVELDDVPA